MVLGKPHPDATQVEGKFEFVVGKPQEFVIRLRDKAGNPVVVKEGHGVTLEAAIKPVDLAGMHKIHNAKRGALAHCAKTEAHPSGALRLCYLNGRRPQKCQI